MYVCMYTCMHVVNIGNNTLTLIPNNATCYITCPEAFVPSGYAVCLGGFWGFLDSAGNTITFMVCYYRYDDVTNPSTMTSQTLLRWRYCPVTNLYMAADVTPLIQVSPDERAILLAFESNSFPLEDPSLGSPHELRDPNTRATSASKRGVFADFNTRVDRSTSTGGTSTRKRGVITGPISASSSNGVANPLTVFQHDLISFYAERALQIDVAKLDRTSRCAHVLTSTANLNSTIDADVKMGLDDSKNNYLELSTFSGGLSGGLSEGNLSTSIGGVRVPEVIWQLDADVSTCVLCDEDFGLFRRKHHCRHCGRIVCSGTKLYTYTHTYIYIYIYMYMYVCMYVCVFIYINLNVITFSNWNAVLRFPNDVYYDVTNPATMTSLPPLL